MLNKNQTRIGSLDLMKPRQNRKRRVFGRARRKAAVYLPVAAGLCLVVCGFGLPAGAQSAVATATEAVPSASTGTALSLVRWNGSFPEAAGRVVQLRFELYQDQAGGIALWNETQTVKVGTDGHYSVLLGATSAEGLPQTLFQAGEARWIEVTPVAAPQGEAATAHQRILLAAVPYAFKAVDAETLAGRAAADYVTREDLQSAVASTVQTVANPETSPTITGAGTVNIVPVWTGASSLGNSVIAESGTKIGIGTASPATTLEVKGITTLNGTTILPAAAAATATAGMSSPELELGASTYSSTTKAAVAQNFALKAVIAGNNTAAPTANLEVLFGKGTATPVGTGLSIAPTGQITFAAGQKFPGTGTITGVTASSPLTGSTTSGAVTLGLDTTVLKTTLNAVYAQLGAANTYTKPITFAAGQTFPGAVSSVAAGTGLLLGGTTAAPSLSVDSTSVPLLSASNNFAGTVHVRANGYGVETLGGYGTLGATGVVGTSDAGVGVVGASATPSNGNAGVFGLTGAVDSNSEGSLYSSYVAGVWGDTTGNPITADYAAGVIGTADKNYAGVFLNNSDGYPAVMASNSATQGTGIVGITNGYSGVFSSDFADIDSSGGVWGDTGAGLGSVAVLGGIVGTADNLPAGYFENDGEDSTVFAINDSNNAHGTLFKTLMASTRKGACGIGGDGDLSCTGQMKSLVSTGGGARRVETYAMQSPENWMEDFGSGLLERGVAVVKIDPAFAETVTDDANYHVFITPRADSKGLYVINATATSFEVRESGGGTSSLSFDYRIVARRRGYEAQRLTDVTEQFNAASEKAIRRADRHSAPIAPRIRLQTPAPNRLAIPESTSTHRLPLVRQQHSASK